MFYWGDYKSPGFDKSNLFLLRIANPQGRLAVDFLESLGVVFCQALSSARRCLLPGVVFRQALSSVRRSAGFAIRRQKMFDPIILRICNPLI